MTGKSRGGLGRGLAALIPTGPETSEAPRADRVADVLINGASRRREPAPLSLVGAGGGAVAVAEAPVIDPETVVDLSTTSGPRYLDIPIDEIRRNPRNPRTVFDEDALVELTHSIREFGLLQPIVVRDVPGGGYELVMGERRWRAGQRAGLTTIPAIVRRTEDADLLRDALLENIHRANLNPLEEVGVFRPSDDRRDRRQTGA